MKKIIITFLLSMFSLSTLLAQDVSIIGVWEQDEKNIEDGIEKTGYLIITDSTLNMTSWKDSGTGTLEEIKQLKNGFKFDIEIKDDVIILVDMGEIKIIELEKNKAIIEMGQGDKAKRNTLRRVTK